MLISRETRRQLFSALRLHTTDSCPAPNFKIVHSCMKSSAGAYAPNCSKSEAISLTVKGWRILNKSHSPCCLLSQAMCTAPGEN